MGFALTLLLLLLLQFLRRFSSPNSLLPLAVNYDLFIILIRLFALSLIPSLSLSLSLYLLLPLTLFGILRLYFGFCFICFVYIFGTADK